MRKLFSLCLVLLLISGLSLAVSAQSGAESAECSTVISKDGSCHVSFTMTLHLEQTTDLQFPVPTGAQNVTVNGTAASFTGRDPLQVSLNPITGNGIGTFTVTVAYDLPTLIHSEKEGLVLKLDILSGFSLPISKFSFSVTLPGTPAQTPTFLSGYYPETVMEHLTVETEGNTIRGSYIGTIFDRETLTLTLPADESMFPDPTITARMMSLVDLVTVIVMVLAIIYFFVFMRPHIHRPQPRYTAPEGVTAGEVGRWLTGDSMDLTLLVVSWAQMGYLRIVYENEERVLLHKRMDMGNERSVFENQVFRALFGRRTALDATGSHYARLCRDVRLKTRRPKDVFHQRSGNPHFFRILCVLAAFLAGIMLGETFALNSVFMQIITGLLAATLAVVIQIGAGKMILRHRRMLYISWAGCALWLTVSLLCGDWLMGIGMVIFQFLAGLALAYGGRRSEIGSQHMYQLLGLRTHTRTAPIQELNRLMRINPGYFHNIAPYALALNTDRAFARRFGNIRVPECSYLTDGRNRQFSPGEWMELLRKTVKAMDARSQRLPTRQVAKRRRR